MNHNVSNSLAMPIIRGVFQPHTLKVIKALRLNINVMVTD